MDGALQMDDPLPRRSGTENQQGAGGEIKARPGLVHEVAQIGTEPQPLKLAHYTLPSRRARRA